MTYEEWVKAVERGVTINPEMAFAAGAASRDDEIAYLQSRIDELMLEYCPDEMTQDQIDNWAKHQQAVPENELPEFLRKP